MPDVVEQERHVIDLSVRFPVFEVLTARIDLKNLLDAPYATTQGPITRESYRVGRGLSIGLSWRK